MNNPFTATKIGWWIMATAVASLIAIGTNKSNTVDNSIANIKGEISQSRERTATLEEAVRNLKSDTSEIKSDVKLLLERKK